jgi:hypothetical protein
VAWCGGYTPNVASLVLERFERQAEAFARARALRDWRYLAGSRPGLDLAPLYEEDFPTFTSTELYGDLHEVSVEDGKQKQSLQAFLAAAHLEGRTRDFAERAARLETRTLVQHASEEIPWRSVQARWMVQPEAALRHALITALRAEMRSGLNPALQHWQEALSEAATPLGGQDWLAFWDGLRGIGLAQMTRLAESLLSSSAKTYRHGLQAYFSLLGLPIDDAWAADADWAFRAPQLDIHFPSISLMPVVVRTLRDLGVELDEQPGIRLDLEERPTKAAGVQCVAIDVPREAWVMCRPVGGYRDYQRLLRGLGQALHIVYTDLSFPFAYRWLGDETTTVAYGFLLEGLTLDRDWLRDRLGLEASDDYRVIAHLAWLYRLRRAAATLLYEQRLWKGGAAGGLAADYADAMSAALHVRHFPEEYLCPLIGGPWQSLRSAVRLRAEVFAAQLLAYLRHEFDEEWHHNPRASRFLVQELWRPGRRYTAEELLGFMGYEGFDVSTLCDDIAEALSTV